MEPGGIGTLLENKLVISNWQGATDTPASIAIEDQVFMSETDCGNSRCAKDLFGRLSCFVCLREGWAMKVVRYDISLPLGAQPYTKTDLGSLSYDNKSSRCIFHANQYGRVAVEIQSIKPAVDGTAETFSIFKVSTAVQDIVK